MGHIELVTAQSGAPKRAFEELKVKGMGPAAISPDGKKIVFLFFDYAKRYLAIGDADSVHAIPTKWWITRPFSWSPDSTKVAFYYALDDGDGIHVQQHGVAVLTVDGELREVVKASEAFETPRSVSKDIPPGWGCSSQFVYYTAGLSPDDPRRSIYKVSVFSPVAATCRVNIQTCEVEEIALGEYACISPDGKYVLVYPSPRPAGDGKWVTGTTKIELKTRQVSYLPDGIGFPIVSPSGKFVFARGNGFRFYRTTDWKPQGEPILSGISIPQEDWATDFRWITVDEKSPFYEPQSQPAP